jgi:hypothetical protein
LDTASPAASTSKTKAGWPVVASSSTTTAVKATM